MSASPVYIKIDKENTGPIREMLLRNCCEAVVKLLEAVVKLL
jgi:hypothetical protein